MIKGNLTKFEKGYIQESDIKSYIEQFNVNEEQAIKEITKIYDEENEKYRIQMEYEYNSTK